MDRDTVYKLGVQSGLLMKGQDFGFKFDEVMKLAELVAAEKDKEIERLRGEVEGLLTAYNIVSEDCRNLTEKVIPNIRFERDAALGRLRGEVEELTNKLQMMKDESLLFQVNVGLARDLKKAIAERDAARGNK